MLAALLAPGAPGGAAPPGPAAAAPLPLAPGESRRVEVRPGAPAVLAVAAEAGRPWVLLAAQPGVDLELTATAADGTVLATADAPLPGRGSERLLVEPEADGEVRVEVAAAEAWAPASEVEVTLGDLAGQPAALAAERATARAAAASASADEEGKAAAPEAWAEAAAAWEAAGRTAEAAAAHFGRAAALRRANRYDEALAAAERAADLYRAAGDGAGEGAAVAAAGAAASWIGDAAAAQERYLAARDLLAAHGDPSGAASAQYHACLGDLKAGRLDAGVPCVEAALAGYRELGDRYNAGAMLATLGYAYQVLGDPDRARAALDESLALARAIEHRSLEAQALNNLAFLLVDLGDARGALAGYERSLELSRQAGDTAWEARALHNLGDFYLALGDAHRARLVLDEALVRRREADDAKGEALTLSILGRALHAAGELAAAAEMQRRAIALLAETDDPRGEATVLFGLARTERDAGDLAAAGEAVERAAALLDPVEHRREAARLPLERGLTRLAAGDAEGAATDLAAAVEAQRALRDPWGEAEALAGLAAAERRRGHLAAAEERYAASVQVVEEARRRVPGRDLRATVLGRWRDVYEDWIDVLMTLHAADPAAGHDRRALAASERARARALLDLLTGAGADLDGRLDPALAERRGALRRRLAVRSARLARLVAKGDPGAAAAEREVYETVAALELLEAEARAADPALAALEAPPPADAAAISARLAADELLVEVALGDERSYLWTVAGGPGAVRVESFVLPGRAEIEAAARQVHEATSRRGGAAAPEAVAAAARLSGWLLPPGRVPPGVGRLLIVPDGALHYLPFASLPAAGDDGAAAPLVARHELVVLPSAATLLVAAPERPAAAGRLAALGDPVFDGSDHRVGAAVAAAGGRAAAGETALRGDEGAGFALPRLRLSRREVEAIAALVPDDEELVVTDFAADRDLVLSGALAGYRALHFATHGILDTAHPELSGLVLSQVDDTGRAKDGFLRLRDLYGLDLAARLVVLSGCHTALGREVRGEGLVGLTRGFLYAGVEQVVASLWQVEDRATAELMERFYRALWLDGLTPAAALARAQREVAADPRWSDPFFWSAFVLQGTSHRPAGPAAAGNASSPRVAGRAEVQRPREDEAWPVVRTTKGRTP